MLGCQLGLQRSRTEQNIVGLRVPPRSPRVSPSCFCPPLRFPGTPFLSLLLSPLLSSPLLPPSTLPACPATCPTCPLGSGMVTTVCSPIPNGYRGSGGTSWGWALAPALIGLLQRWGAEQDATGWAAPHASAPQARLCPTMAGGHRASQNSGGKTHMQRRHQGGHTAHFSRDAISTGSWTGLCLQEDLEQSRKTSVPSVLASLPNEGHLSLTLPQVW